MQMPGPREQVEYYFSAKNIPGDTYLRSRMDPLGWVALEEIAQFPRMLALGTTVDGIANALAGSERVEVSADGLCVRIRCHQLRASCPWVRWSDKAASRSLLAIRKVLKQRLKQFALSKRAKKSTRTMRSAEGPDFIPLRHSNVEASRPQGVIAKAIDSHMAGQFVKASAAKPIYQVPSVPGAKGKAASAGVSCQAVGALCKSGMAVKCKSGMAVKCKSGMAVKCAALGVGISPIFVKAPGHFQKAGAMAVPSVVLKAVPAAMPLPKLSTLCASLRASTRQPGSVQVGGPLA